MNSQQQQYQLVLRFMQVVNIDDFSDAQRIMKTYHYNLENAINSQLNNNQPSMDNYRQQRQEQQEDGGVRKYIQLLYRKRQNQNLFKSIFIFITNTLRGIFLCFAKILFPQILKRVTINSNFANLYKSSLKIYLDDSKFKITLRKTRVSSKPGFLALSGKNYDARVSNLANKPEIRRSLDQNYLFCGLIQGDKDVNLFNCDKQYPMVIIFRENIYEEVQIIKIFTQRDFESLNEDSLSSMLQIVKNKQRNDRNVLIRYRNHIRRTALGRNAVFYEQDEQQAPMIREHRKKSTQMIRQQNQLYQQIQLEAQKKRKQQSQLSKILEEKQQERNARKMSIPEEPQSGDIIRLHFRTPTGQSKVRAFLSSQKVQLLFNWVQTNTQIQFEDPKRSFELLYSYPTIKLSDKQQKTLSQVFDCDQQKIMIREL